MSRPLDWRISYRLLTREENLVGLMAVNREVLAQVEMPTRAGRIVLDMDSRESPVHGAQEGSAYNGHFETVCYHPLFLFPATERPGLQLGHTRSVTRAFWRRVATRCGGAPVSRAVGPSLLNRCDRFGCVRRSVSSETSQGGDGPVDCRGGVAG